MKHDPEYKMRIISHGYRRTCELCDWSIWWDTQPTNDDMTTIAFKHDVERPECAMERQALEAEGYDDE